MLDTIHNLNDSDFPGIFVLFTFYVVSMFPSTGDERDIKAVKKLLRKILLLNMCERF